jgi:hypothetical protein
MEKYVVFHVEGGLGKNVASTAVIPAIKKKYKDRKLVVLASWPEIYLNNPHIHRVYRLGTSPYFWDDYINKKDSIFLRREPYFETGHIMQKDSLIKTWHQMYDLEYSGKELPQIYMNMMQSAYSQMWRREKPVMVLHTNGGPIMDNQPVYSWSRDIPFHLATEIVNKFGNQYHIIQVCKHDNQRIQSPLVEHVVRQMSNYELFTLLHVSAKRVLIDSCLQHAAAAFNLPSTVLWVGTRPNIFGYDVHNNIVANKPADNLKLPDSVYFDFQLGGLYHECPYTNFEEIFDTKKVLDEIERF